MSDGTPETAMDAGNADPSMEDILASIRRIIADDADDSADTSIAADVDVSTKAAATTTDEDQNTALVSGEGEIDLSEFDDILIMDDENFAAEDLQIPDADIFNSADVDIAAAPLEGASSQGVSSLDAEILDIIESVDLGETGDTVETLDVDLTADAVSAIDLVNIDIADTETVASDQNVTGPVSVASEVETTSSSDDDLLSMFDEDINLVLEMDSTIDFNDISGVSDTAAVTIEAPVETVDPIAADTETADAMDLVETLLSDNSPAISADEAALEDLMASETLIDDALDADLPDLLESDDLSSDDDLDLVKSLMADLTDDNLESEEPAQEAAVFDESSLVDDILDLTIDDELNLGPEDIDPLDMTLLETPNPDITLGAEADETKSILDDLMDDEDNGEDSFNALLAIAASAEKEASGLEAGTPDLAAEADIEVDTSIDMQEDLDILDALEMDIEEPDLDISSALLELEQSLETTSIMDAIMPTAETAADEQDPIDFEALIEIAGDTEIAAESILDVDAATHSAAEADFEALVEIGGDDDHDPAVEASDLLDMPEGAVDADADDLDTEPTDELAAIFEDVEDEMSAAAMIAGDNTPAEAAAPKAETSPESHKGEAETPLPETQLKPEIDPNQEQENSLMPQLVAKDGILDDVTEAASAEAFSELNQLVEERAVFAESGPRIGDLVQEALRPMLKEWLDSNLKGIVERAVAKEVKRISTGK